MFTYASKYFSHRNQQIVKPLQMSEPSDVPSGCNIKYNSAVFVVYVCFQIYFLIDYHCKTSNQRLVNPSLMSKFFDVNQLKRDDVAL